MTNPLYIFQLLITGLTTLNQITWCFSCIPYEVYEQNMQFSSQTMEINWYSILNKKLNKINSFTEYCYTWNHEIGNVVYLYYYNDDR